MDTTTKAINWASIVFGALLGIGVGLVVYRKTTARARQLEAEERSKAEQGNNSVVNGGGTRGLEHPDDFVDDLGDDWDDDGQENDDIDFLGEAGRDGSAESYKDEPAERQTSYGEDEESAIGLDRQRSKPKR